MTVLKPFVLIACVAFVAGFMGYVALARVAMAPEASSVAATEAPLSSTVSQPAPPPPTDFNPGKLI